MRPGWTQLTVTVLRGLQNLGAPHRSELGLGLGIAACSSRWPWQGLSHHLTEEPARGTDTSSAASAAVSLTSRCCQLRATAAPEVTDFTCQNPSDILSLCPGCKEAHIACSLWSEAGWVGAVVLSWAGR